jgi:hypothetical protein
MILISFAGDYQYTIRIRPVGGIVFSKAMIIIEHYLLPRLSHNGG